MEGEYPEGRGIFRGASEAQKLSCGYSLSHPLLSELDLILEIGQAVAIIGPNGAGKTTLLRTLIGTLPPLSGKIMLQGEELYKRLIC